MAIWLNGMPFNQLLDSYNTMGLLRDLNSKLSNLEESRAWLLDMLDCHTEIIQDSQNVHLEPYPFFTFIALGEFTLLAIFNSPTDIRIYGIAIPEQDMIQSGERMAMSDTEQMLGFLKSNHDRIEFEHTVSISYLRNNSV